MNIPASMLNWKTVTLNNRVKYCNRVIALSKELDNEFRKTIRVSDDERTVYVTIQTLTKKFVLRIFI